MRRIKALVLISVMFISTFLIVMPPVAKAEEGYAKVYIICLSDVWYGWTFPNRQYDPSITKDGAIEALLFKEDTHIPLAHPKLGNAPPFYGIDYQVVTDWNTYKLIIESYENIIVINTHGEIIPVPSNYNRENWTDKVAEAMLKHRVSWVHTAGYPFYYAWYQGAGDKEVPAWGEEGFKRLMSNINLANVTCPYDSETTPKTLNDAAREEFCDTWSKFDFAWRAQRGRPLRASDFKNYTAMPIWGSEDDYMTGAVISFLKPSERSLNRRGFGTYVHIGTNATFTSDNIDYGGDYYRGFVGAVAAVWSQVLSFRQTEQTREYVEYSYHSSWGICITPVITHYDYDDYEDKYTIDIDFAVYGILKTNSTERMGGSQFYLKCPSDCTVMMDSSASKNGKKNDNPTVGFDWVGAAKFGVTLALAFIDPEPCTKTWLIANLLTGCILFSDFVGLLPAITDKIEGIDELQGPITDEVEFKYDPSKFSESAGDWAYEEFESTFHVELTVNMSNREQWTIIPLKWYLGVMNSTSPISRVSTWAHTYIALHKTPTETPKVTVFFDDFDFVDWSVQDANSTAGYDYWGKHPTIWDGGIYCAGVGNNSLFDEKPNTEAYGGNPVYDKGMNATLTLSIDSAAYRNTWLRYGLYLVASDGDYLVVECYVNGVWNNLAIHTHWTDGRSPDPYEVPLPVAATKIRFRFCSNDDEYVNYGARLDYVEIKAELPNDAMNTWQDAGQFFGEAMDISGSTCYYGYLGNDEDWYNFTVTTSDITAGKQIYMQIYAPSNAYFAAELYNPAGQKKGGPSATISYYLTSADFSGDWTIRIIPIKGFGRYNFNLNKFTPSGGGGCPFVYVWSGTQFVLDNNILPASELGHGADVEDYYKLEQHTVPVYRGSTLSFYSFKIGEYEMEHSYIDQVKLTAIDHVPNVNIAVTPSGEILTYKNPTAPLSAIDTNGNNRLNEVCLMDGNVSDPTTYFDGYPDDYLTLNFGEVNSENAKLILRTDKKKMDECILVQMKNSSGLWQTVETLTPRAYWSMEAVNLSNYVIEGEDFMVRLYWKNPHRLDYVGLDTAPQENYTLRTATLVLAIHSAGENIYSKLLANDENYAELTPSQSMWLTFAMLNPEPEATTTFIFYTEGHYNTIT